jgi:hypothetical protein
MGRTFSIYGISDECVQTFGNVKERDNFGAVGIDGRIILKCEGVVWIQMAPNKNQ